MSLTVRARVEIDAGSESYSANDTVATVDYVDGTVPKEFLAHAYNSGKVYVEDVSSNPWVRRAKARHAMMVGDTAVAADGAVCDITTTDDLGTDVVLRMREARLVKGLGLSVDAEE